METETRNLEFTGILSVIERQVYSRAGSVGGGGARAKIDMVEQTRNENTDVTTTVTLLSRFGQARRQKRREEDAMVARAGEEEDVPRRGLFSSWSTSSLQRTIEGLGLRRTREALAKSKEGMNVVLERLRHGGLARVLEGMQQDRMMVPGQEGMWKQAWRQGQDKES